MSTSPPPPGYPADPYAYGGYYPPYDPHRSSRVLVLLAGIFMAITAGCNLLAGVGWGIASIVVAFNTSAFRRTDDTVVMLVFAGLGVGGIIAGSLQTVSALKLLRKRADAARWGLVGGIASCVDLWCYIGCVLSLAFGVFTIVISCLTSVRQFLAEYNRSEASSSAFPVQGRS